MIDPLTVKIDVSIVRQNRVRLLAACYQQAEALLSGEMTEDSPEFKAWIAETQILYADLKWYKDNIENKA